MEHGCWKMRTMLEITIVDWKRILVFFSWYRWYRVWLGLDGRVAGWVQFVPDSERYRFVGTPRFWYFTEDFFGYVWIISNHSQLPNGETESAGRSNLYPLIPSQGFWGDAVFFSAQTIGTCSSVAGETPLRGLETNQVHKIWPSGKQTVCYWSHGPVDL